MTRAGKDFTDTQVIDSEIYLRNRGEYQKKTAQQSRFFDEYTQLKLVIRFR